MSPSRKQWIVSLMKDWGFNTAACWSSPSVWNDLYVTDQIYARFIPHANDVFDASFWQGPYAAHLTNEVMPFRGKKNFIGTFWTMNQSGRRSACLSFICASGRASQGARPLPPTSKRITRGRSAR